MEAGWGQKHPSEAKNGMKELIYWKKYLIKVSNNLKNPFSWSNQIWATTSGQKVMIFDATQVTSAYTARVRS